MTHQFSIGEKARIVKLITDYEKKKYEVGNIITIDEVVERAPCPYFHDNDCFYEFQLAPVFEVGDEVEIVDPDKLSVSNGHKKGTRFIIDKITRRTLYRDLLYSPPDSMTGFLESELKLIKKGGSMCGQEKSLRDRKSVAEAINKILMSYYGCSTHPKCLEEILTLLDNSLSERPMISRQESIKIITDNVHILPVDLLAKDLADAILGHIPAPEKECAKCKCEDKNTDYQLKVCCGKEEK